MVWTGEATERTTAATDAVLAAATVVAIVLLHRFSPPSFGRAVWRSALAGLALASVLGAVAHGVPMTVQARELLWQPLYLSLGVTMALFVVGALRDWRGNAAARRALMPMLVVALVFYGVTWLTGGDFLAFVVYEACALLFALFVYLRLAMPPRRSGARTMAAALAVSLAAGAVQASHFGSIRLVWDFDHNGLFHLAQLVGLTLMVVALRRLLPAAALEGP